MHCGANVGEFDDSALFFGLSGTGKTSLSADPKRKLIGDDEHGWGENGVFNFEGGCYAKLINLNKSLEPQIYYAIRRFGALAENVVIDPKTGMINYSDHSVTENTRGTFPVKYIDSAVLIGRGSHPKNIFFLTADAFGVIPPLSRLTPEQAIYYFLTGYTAKVGGTEVGVNNPQPTFSTGFGGPFLPLHAEEYATLLEAKLKENPETKVWLVNTGWSGLSYEVNGKEGRMPIQYSRAMITAAISGQLDSAPTEKHDILKLDVIKQCQEVPPEVMRPWKYLTDIPDYTNRANHIAKLFCEHFEENFQKLDHLVKHGPKPME